MSTYDRYLNSVKPPSRIPHHQYPGTLYLGGIDVLKDGTAKSYDHIVSIITSSELTYAMHPSITENTSQRRDHYVARDLPDFDMTEIFEAAVEAIQESLKEGKTVYVHCFMGKSRSAAVVTAWLIKYGKMHYEKARMYLRGSRPCVHVNSGFREQLKEFEKRLASGAEEVVPGQAADGVSGNLEKTVGDVVAANEEVLQSEQPTTGSTVDSCKCNAELDTDLESSSSLKLVEIPA